MNMTAILLVMGIPTAVTAFCFWMIERRISLRDKKQEETAKKRQEQIEEKEKTRDELQYLMIQTINASMALSEATAKAVERIPDAHCNGDMHAALEYASGIKHKQKEFLTKQGIKNVYEDIA